MRLHADSRSSDAFNLTLSQTLAEATMEYIVAAGIDTSRITGRGHGESQLLNQCANGVKCSEAGHQLTRRTEFIIVEN